MADGTFAWYIYPLKKGTSYTKFDLMKEDIVETVFDYCQILLCIVTYEGWEFLLDYHGIEKLYEINLRSEWLSTESLEEFQKDVMYYLEISKPENGE